MARVLLIEDNPTSLELMAYLLTAFGHSLMLSSDGIEGVALAQNERPEIVVCDIQLPSIDGFEVARRIRSSPDLAVVPLVAVTALAMVGDRDRILAGGFDGYISKPIDPETFVAEVEHFLPAAVT